MTFKNCSWCGYIYPVTAGQSACPYCGCKNSNLNKNSHPKKDGASPIKRK